MYDPREYRIARPFIQNEARDSEGTREYVILAAGTVYTDGRVLSKNSTTGRAAPYDPNAQDGTEVARGILIGDYDTTGGERLALMLTRLAEVKRDLIDWGGIDADGIAAGTAALATNGILIV